MEPIYCPEDDTCRIKGNVCDKLCIDRYYSNHLKSTTHINNLKQRSLTIQ